MFHPKTNDFSIYNWDVYYKDKTMKIYKHLNEDDNLFITIDGNKLYNEAKKKGLIEYTIYYICFLSLEITEKLMERHNIPQKEKYDLLFSVIESIHIPFIELFGEFSMEIWQYFKIWKKNNT